MYLVTAHLTLVQQKKCAAFCQWMKPTCCIRSGLACIFISIKFYSVVPIFGKFSEFTKLYTLTIANI